MVATVGQHSGGCAVVIDHIETDMVARLETIVGGTRFVDSRADFDFHLFIVGDRTRRGWLISGALRTRYGKNRHTYTH